MTRGLVGTNGKQLLLLGLTTTVILGALATAAFAAQQPTSPSPTLIVPVGGIGDVAEYVVEWERFQDELGQAINERGSYAHAIRVEGVATARDRTMAVHDTVKIAFVRRAPDFAMHGADFLDLETRDLIHDRQHMGTEANPFGTYNFGPSAGNPYLDAQSFDPIRDAPFDLTRDGKAQGKTFRVGQDLTEEELPGLFLEAILAKYQHEFDIEVKEFEYRAWVDASGTLGSYPVFSIVRTLRINYLLGDTITFVNNTPTQEWVDETRTTTWHAPDLPWPVRVEKTFIRNGTASWNWLGQIHNYRLVRDLVSYTPGTVEIPWGDCRQDVHYRPHNPEAEHSGPAEMVPESGAAFRLPYRAEDAVRSIRQDASLTQFGAWTGRHPDNLVVGLTFAERVPGARAPSAKGELDSLIRAVDPETTPTWTVVFADPDAVGSSERWYVVTSSRNASNGVTINREWGSGAIPENRGFALDDIPRNPVTFGYMDETIRILAPQEIGATPPSTLMWGYAGRFRDGGVYLTGGPWFHQMFADRNQVDATVDPELALAARHMYHHIWVDAVTGNITGLAIYTWDDKPFPFEPGKQMAAVLGHNDAFVPATSPPTRREAVAVAVTASVISVALLAYFLPLLKIVGARAVLFVPGYAKLRKHDLLNHKTREAVLQLIRQDPGISPPEIARQTGSAWTTLIYHLGVLEKNKLVNSMIDGRHKRYFPTESVDWSRRGRLAALRNEKTHAIYQMLLVEPGLSRKDVARRMGFSPTAADWHLERLQAVQLAGADREGRRFRFYANSDARPPDRPAVEVV